MDHCTECNFPLEEGMLTCPQCGADISLMDIDEPKHETIGFMDTVDLAGNHRAENIGQTLAAGSETSPAADNTDDEDIDSDGETAGSPGSGTINAPGVEADSGSQHHNSIADDEDEDDVLGQTIDAGLTELDEAEDFDFDDDFPGVQSDAFPLPGQNTTVFASAPEESDLSGEEENSTDNQATLHFGNDDAGSDADLAATIEAASSPRLDDPYSTHIDERDDKLTKDDAGNLTIDVSSEDRPTHADGTATIDITGESTSREATSISASSDSGDSDQAGTVVMSDGITETPGDKTVIYESTSNENSTIEASGATGTEGRLKDLWAGVAGSSENPMHSLQAVGLQASDTIFQRVATRRVADASTSEDSLADYQIVDKLGEGAMGIVFSARQTAVNRIVALKTAKPSFQANDESRRRFLYEAHITADLDHSNIVPIHELGASEEGMLFYSMKLVQGTEWSRVMRKKTREQNLEIFMKVADAMAFAHSKGVIHRDLKPENTMLGRFGEVFVTDWGTAINLDKDTTKLAKPAAKGERSMTVEDGSNFLRGDSIVLHNGVEAYDRLQIVSIDEADKNRLYFRKKLTRAYEPSSSLRVVKAMNLAGTPCYMAPEMAGHLLPKIGKQSDIYILGAILFDLVTGKPPHTGNSVTQCLRAALRNEAIETARDSDDALMTIALKAMATEPRDRYQTVEELQDAVREYRRHAESITLTERSDDLLVKAIEHKDYQSFSRTMFGYRDAIELWPENKAAVSGLRKSRLAFGEVAFKNGDNDLVLQTLDRDVPEEASLYKQAVEAKKKADGREASLRILKRVIAAVILLAVAGLSFLTFIANQQRVLAVAKEKEAIESAEQEKLAKEAAIAAEIDANNARDAAVDAKKAAEDATVLAEMAKKQEEIEKAIALDAKAEALKQKGIAELNFTKAEEQRILAENAEESAVAAANLAKRRSAQIQLGEYNSSLALAKSQIESFDMAASSENLLRLEDMFKKTGDEDVFLGNAPKIDTWGWKRIQLLGNIDLPRAQVGDQAGGDTAADVSVSAYAPAADVAVVGTKAGLIQLLAYENRRLTGTRSISEPHATINAVAISPDGKEVVYALTREQDGKKVSDVKRWEVTQDTAEEVVATKNRLFQHFTYSSDGQQLLAGISGGIWIWNRSADWYSQEEPAKRVNSIRGELTNLQGIGPQRSLLTTDFQGQVLLGVLDHASGTINLVDVASQLSAPIASAGHTFIDNRIVLGLSNNQLAIGTLDTVAAKITDLIELENKHRAPVTSIVSDGRRRLITSSISEPVAHVWSYDATAHQWAYDTYLTGTPKNIAGLGLLGEGRVMAVDQAGTSIVWDVERQKQRRRLQRTNESKVEEYPSAIQAIVAGPSDGRAIAIDEDGVVDLWSLSDGSTTRLDLSRWSYFGHTPGAELVDSAVDLERGIVVTAASLQKARKEYLSDSTHAWEFCTWNAKNGQMLRRWTAASREVADARIESIEQRISLVDSGRQILFASDSETRLVDLSTAGETFVSDDFGSYFAIPNPRNSSLLMLVKRSGSVRLLDIRNPSSWDVADNRNFSLAEPSDIPLQGIWSDDGQRFYLTFATGGMAKFQWIGGRLDLVWSTRRSADVGANRQLSQTLTVDGGRVKSHLDVELLLAGDANNEVLHVATRNRGSSPTTKLISLRFTSSSELPVVVKNTRVQGVLWLQRRGSDGPTLTAEVHDVLIVDSARVRSRLKVSNKVFVSTTSAQVLELVDGQRSVTSFGRSKLISTTGSYDGQSLIALHEDGSIWKFSIAGTSGEWTRLTYTALGASKICLSPDGQLMLIENAGKVSLVNPQSGREVAALGEVRAAAWEAKPGARLAFVTSGGELKIWEAGMATLLPEKPNYSNSDKIVGVHFFNEVWSNGKAARQFLVVHSEREGKGLVQFVPIDPAPADAADAHAADGDAPAVTEIPMDCKLAVSPTENIIVTGAPNGTVAVMFAAPTHDRQPHQLFDLEGHRGGDITCLQFTNDGRTIITADTKNRLFAWLSTDPQLTDN